MAQKQISPQERALMFGKSTRQNIQMLPKQTVNQGQQTVQFTLPKARLLSKISFDVIAKIKIKHASQTTIKQDVFSPYKLLRRVQLDLNNGFSPFVIGGKELAMYNMIRLNPSVIIPQNKNSRGMCFFPTCVASSAGTDNTFKFTVELPVALNQRDAIGLILLQNEATQVTLSIDIANGADIFENQEGYTVDIQSVEISPSTETFSVPAIEQAFPDLSVIKLVNSKTETFAGSGQNIIKLATGTMYRKLLFYVTDNDGIPFKDEDITSNIELIFNQADINYSIRAESLAHLNESNLGYSLPEGLFIFDFTYQGIPNLGGTRDIIDTEKLTEFWLRFSSQKSGKITVVSENLARLK